MSAGRWASIQIATEFQERLLRSVTSQSDIRSSGGRKDVKMKNSSSKKLHEDGDTMGTAS
jgi:hypothetical protein